MTRFFSSFAVCLAVASGGIAQSWNGYGGNAQHSGQFHGVSQAANKIHWQAPLDDQPSYYGGEVLIHYASVMVTGANTVVHGYRTTSTNNGVSNYDNWSLMGRNGTRGTLVWRLDTDYSAPALFPNSWTSVYPATLSPGINGSTAVVAGAGGGSVLVRTSADAVSSGTTRHVFYTTVADYLANKAAYAPVKIDTPLTADGAGNVFFGYEVTGSVPPSLAKLGTGGVVRINLLTGLSTYQSVQSLKIDPSLTAPSLNAAPALSTDRLSVYFALTGANATLVKLNSLSLLPTAHTNLFDPSIGGAGVSFPNVSSASPCVGPDGHVFMGVFGNQWRESHGWMLQFDSNLGQTDSAGKQFPVGAFGWDDTPSIVPSSIVPSYKGTSSYLILTKYNNYDDDGGDPGADGSNKVAVLDPGSNSTSVDRQSGIPVMNEVLTVLGPQHINNDSSHPDATYEWCINAAAVDIQQRGAIINSEDGHVYRWSFASNKITETVYLQPATGEAYTSTAIGPDGQLYATNNSILFAVGSIAQATSVSVYQGTPAKGVLSDVFKLDGLTYSTGSVSASAGSVAAIEADFVLPGSTTSGVNVTAYAAAQTGVTGYLYAYNFTTKAFVLLSDHAMSVQQTLLSGATPSNGSQFIGPQGQVRIILRAVMPLHISANSFTLAADQITCGVQG